MGNQVASEVEYQDASVDPIEPGYPAQGVDPTQREETEGTENDPVQLTRLDQLLQNDRAGLVLECRESIELLDEFKLQRSATNADMDAVRKSLFAKGISKDALAIAVKVSKLKEKEMDGFFLCLSVLLEAVGRPVDVDQMDLFLND